MQTCELCGSEAVFIDYEWVKYNFSYDEELEAQYECTNRDCGHQFGIRDEKNKMNRMEREGD